MLGAYCNDGLLVVMQIVDVHVAVFTVCLDVGSKLTGLSGDRLIETDYHQQPQVLSPYLWPPESMFVSIPPVNSTKHMVLTFDVIELLLAFRYLIVLSGTHSLLVQPNDQCRRYYGLGRVRSTLTVSIG